MVGAGGGRGLGVGSGEGLGRRGCRVWGQAGSDRVGGV